MEQQFGGPLHVQRWRREGDSEGDGRPAGAAQAAEAGDNDAGGAGRWQRQRDGGMVPVARSIEEMADGERGQRARFSQKRRKGKMGRPCIGPTIGKAILAGQLWPARGGAWSSG